MERRKFTREFKLEANLLPPPRLPFAICAHCDAVRVSGILLSYSER
jgi:hypothetical protein